MSYMPSEIIGEILIWLPAKSLLSYRCVSKEWRSLIDSKEFVKRHLDNSAKTNFNGTVVIQSNKLFYIHSDSFQSSQFDTGITGFDGYTVTSSCNGLVLLSSKSGDNVLWNPSTRKLKKLPRRSQLSSWSNCVLLSPRRPYFLNLRTYALGYDSKNDDYKVVTFLHRVTRPPSFLSCEVIIYSVKSNSWKRIADFPYMLHNYLRWGVCLNDALHALRKNRNSSKDIMPFAFLNKNRYEDDDNSSEAIMAFDLVNEKHYEVPKPEFIDVHSRLLSVEVLRGCLTLAVAGNITSMEIWVMKEYGVKESWSKLLCFDTLIPKPCCLSPLAYSKSGDEVLLNYDRMYLHWCDLRKETYSIAFGGNPCSDSDCATLSPSFDAVFCIDSLVSPGEVEPPEQNRE